MRTFLFALLIILFTTSVAAEEAIRGERLLFIDDGEEGASTGEMIETYLADLDVEVVSIRRSLPPGGFAEVRSAVTELAAGEGATYAVWVRPSGASTLVLYIAHVSGETALVRTIDLDDEPPTLLRRTIAAVVHTVVDARILQVSSRTDASPVRDAPPRGSTAEPEPEVDLDAELPPDETRRLRLGLQLGYGMRWISAPGPLYQLASLGFRANFLDWVGIRLSGRLGFPAEPAVPDGGRIWRASFSAAVGLERVLSVLRWGLLLGVDVEWLWGSVKLGAERGDAAFDHVSVGLSLRTLVNVRIVEGLHVFTALCAAVRPERKLYLLRSIPAVSSGHWEIGVEIGLAWDFL